MWWSKLTGKIEQASVLDPVANAVEKGVNAVLPGGPVKDALHGVWLGHPLHPAITDIPVGAWTVALICDTAEAVSGNRKMGAAADVSIAIGLLGAAGSAVTGLADWSETDSRAKKIGAVHGVLNVAATALYTASWILRGRAKRRRTARTLSALGYAIAGASAYLGGHLVMGEQVGVDHTATADVTQPEKYTKVVEEEKLRENKPLRVVADGVAICLVRRDGEIHAITDTCPHLGGPLSEGKLRGDAIECPWHGSQLSIVDGHVVNGPTTYAARVFDVRVRAGQIEVRARKQEESGGE